MHSADGQPITPMEPLHRLSDRAEPAPSIVIGSKVKSSLSNMNRLGTWQSRTRTKPLSQRHTDHGVKALRDTDGERGMLRQDRALRHRLPVAEHTI
jgi:hypothetical protein